MEDVPQVRPADEGANTYQHILELAGDAPGDAVQLHAVQLAFAHAIREHPEEVAHAAGRFQNVAAVKAHLLHGLINGADHHIVMPSIVQSYLASLILISSLWTL